MALGLCPLGAACAGSGGGDEAGAVEAGEIGTVGATVPEPMPDAVPDRGRRVGDVVPVGAGGKLAVLDAEDDVNAGALFHPERGKRFFAIEVKGCAGRNESDLSFEPEFFGLRLEGYL